MALVQTADQEVSDVMDKLKTCPFCGGEAKIVRKDGVFRHHWFVYCQQTETARVQKVEAHPLCCPMTKMTSPKSWATKELAVNHWNSRPIEKKLEERIKKLEAEVATMPKNAKYFDVEKYYNG